MTRTTRSRGSHFHGTGEPVPVIAACFGRLPERVPLENLLRSAHAVLFVDARTDLFFRLRSLQPCVIIFPPIDDASVSTAPLIARVVAEAPAIHPLVLIDVQEHRALPAAIRAGATLMTRDGVLSYIADVLDRRSPLAGLSDDERRALVGVAETLAPPTLRGALLYCVEGSPHGLTVEGLARRMGVSRRTLSRYTKLASWPPPSELIVWGCLLRASIARRRGGTSTPAIARDAGFRSTQAMRRAVHRYVDPDASILEVLTPMQVTVSLRRRLSALARGP